jgi:hypothetical protein
VRNSTASSSRSDAPLIEPMRVNDAVERASAESPDRGALLGVSQSLEQKRTPSREMLLGLRLGTRALEGMNRAVARYAPACCAPMEVLPPEEGPLLVVIADGKGVPMRRPAQDCPRPHRGDPDDGTACLRYDAETARCRHFASHIARAPAACLSSPGSIAATRGGGRGRRPADPHVRERDRLRASAVKEKNRALVSSRALAGIIRKRAVPKYLGSGSWAATG